MLPMLFLKEKPNPQDGSKIATQYTSAFCTEIGDGAGFYSEGNEMIQLTRLNNSPLVVNSDLIKFIESAPDTVITLLTGEKIVVLESAEQVLERIVDFRRQVLKGAASADGPAVPAADVSEPLGTNEVP